MSLLAQFIGPCFVFLLVFYLPSLTTEVHAQAAPDVWMDEENILTSTTSRDHLEVKTTPNTHDAKASGCGFVPRLDFAKPKDEFLDQPTFPTGSKVYYNCRPRYVHIPGSISYAMCNDDGTWSFSGEFCTREEKQVPSTTSTYTSKASGCDFVPRLDFAQPKDELPDQPTFPTGSRVYYNCRPGYVRIPGLISYIICNDDGTWWFPTNFCTRKSCGNPGQVDNAEMEAQDFLFGSKVIYNCNRGYKMITKRNYRECLADGTWSYRLPECEVQLCQQPTDIMKGGFSPVKEEYAYLDSVTYYCSRPLTLIGNGTISCMENGQWSSDAPQCRSVRCTNPYVVNARKVSGISGSYSLNSIVGFRCQPGFLLNGSDIVTCNENSQWEPALPKCLDSCRFIPVLKYADLLEPPKLAYVEGTTLTFKCKEGFIPIPGTNNVLTCLGNVWTEAVKFCAPVFCGDPGSIRNGYREENEESFYFGSRVTFACNTGYKISGRYYRECQANGSWSFPIPKCTVQTCPHLDVNLGTSVFPVKPQYQYNDTLTLSCSKGFQLIGSSQSVCTHEGKWQPTPASCKSICDAPPELEFAELIFEYNKTFVEDDTVHYACKDGYTRDSQHTNILNCLGYFEWSEPEQFCSRIFCGPPGNIRHGNYQVKDFRFGSEAVYKCEKGYKLLLDISTRKCLATGTWSGRVPRCQVQTCPPPEDIVNGSYNNKKNKYIYLDSVTYKCHNLTLVGEASISCTAEGKWTSEAPECKAVCKSPPQIQYGEPKTSQNQYLEVGKTLKYKCRPGYIFAGNKSNEITCLNNFTWTEPEKFCERLACNNPGAIAHGVMHYDNFLFESTVNYTCMPGYTMISRRNYRSCQADGTWSGTPPVCKASICDKMWELQEETRKCTSTPEDWIKYLQVQLLYFQIENLKLDIEIKKKKLQSAEESITWGKNEDS